MYRKEIHVVPADQEGWRVLAARAGQRAKLLHTASTKESAVNWARVISRIQGAELLIHNLDGTIRRADSHEHDPNPPRG